MVGRLCARLSGAAVLLSVGLAGAAAEPQAATTPPAVAAVVRWPAVLPCAHPRWLQLWGKFSGSVAWASADGTKSVSFAAAQQEAPIRLRGDFPAGQLDRLWNSNGEQLPTGMSLDCSDASQTSEQHAIDWRLASDGQYEVSSSYPIARVPRAQRLERWIKPKDPANLLTNPEAASLFQKKIGQLGRSDAELRRPATELGRDLASDLREFLRQTCGRGRCGAWLRNADASLATLLRAPVTVYERMDRDPSQPEPFGHGYEWKLSCEGSSVIVKCSDPNHQVLCSLTLEVGPGSHLAYNAFAGEIALDAPPGTIEFDQSSAETKVVLTGSALSLSARP